MYQYVCFHSHPKYWGFDISPPNIPAKIQMNIKAAGLKILFLKQPGFFMSFKRRNLKNGKYIQ
jgi:hypothetical protein